MLNTLLLLLASVLVGAFTLKVIVLRRGCSGWCGGPWRGAVPENLLKMDRDIVERVARPEHSSTSRPNLSTLYGMW